MKEETEQQEASHKEPAAPARCGTYRLAARLDEEGLARDFEGLVRVERNGVTFLEDPEKAP